MNTPKEDEEERENIPYTTWKIRETGEQKQVSVFYTIMYIMYNVQSCTIMYNHVHHVTVNTYIYITGFWSGKRTRFYLSKPVLKV